MSEVNTTVITKPTHIRLELTVEQVKELIGNGPYTGLATQASDWLWNQVINNHDVEDRPNIMDSIYWGLRDALAEHQS